MTHLGSPFKLDDVSRARLVRENLRQEKEVVADLRQFGFTGQSLAQFRDSGADPRPTLPLLLHWLRRVTSPDVKTAIVQCLSDRRASEAAGELLTIYTQTPIEHHLLRWTIGNAVDATAKPELAPRIIPIVADAANGMSRQMLVHVLGRLKDRTAIPTLIQLLDQDDVAGHASIALGKLRAVDAVEPLRRLRTDVRPWIRKEALKALKRIKG